MNPEDYLIPIYNSSFLLTSSGTNVAPAAELAGGGEEEEFHTVRVPAPCDPKGAPPAPEVLQLLLWGPFLES